MTFWFANRRTEKFDAFFFASLLAFFLNPISTSLLFIVFVKESITVVTFSTFIVLTWNSCWL